MFIPIKREIMAVLLLILPKHWNIIKLNNWIGQIAGQNHWSQEVLHQCQTKCMPTMSILCAQIVQLYFFLFIAQFIQNNFEIEYGSKGYFLETHWVQTSWALWFNVGLFCYTVVVS